MLIKVLLLNEPDNEEIELTASQAEQVLKVVRPEPLPAGREAVTPKQPAFSCMAAYRTYVATSGLNWKPGW